MAHDTNRPVPRPTPIDPSEKAEILRELLTVERARLENALRMETERSIVFPETTVIIKDIERLVAALSATAADDLEEPAPAQLPKRATYQGGPLYPTRKAEK